MDKTEVEVILNILGGAYNVKVNDNQLDAFGSILKGIPRLYGYRAVNEYMKFGRFFPRPSEIYGIARNMVINSELRNGWKPPEDKRDEFLMWQMVKLGIDSPDKLPENMVRSVYRDDMRPTIGMQEVQE